MALHRVSAVLGALTIALSLAACGTSDSPKTSGAEDKADFGKCQVSSKAGSVTLTPIQAGILTLQTSLPAQGWFNGTTPESIKDGFEYCLAAELANMGGLKAITVKNVPFDALVAGRQDTYDIAMSQISITAERAKIVDFSPQYYESTIGVLVKKGADVTEANVASKRCGAVSGTTAVEFVRKTLKCKDVRVFSNGQGFYQAVLSGQVDAAFSDTSNVLAQANSVPSEQVVGQYKTGEQYGAIIPKNSANKAAFETAYKTLLSDGTIEKLSKTYLAPAFGGDPASIPVWTAP